MKKVTIIAVSALLCIAFSGCAGSDKPEMSQPDIKFKYVENADTAETSNPEKSDNTDSQSQEQAKNEESANIKETDTQPQKQAENEKTTNNNASEDDVEINLSGFVLETGDNTIICSKVFTGEYTPDGKYVDTNTMVSFSEIDEQVNITVSFQGTSTFTLRETRNNGTDGKDSPAAFNDIETGDLLDMRGYYDGDVFIAKNTIIYRNMDIR